MREKIYGQPASHARLRVQAVDVIDQDFNLAIWQAKEAYEWNQRGSDEFRTEKV